MLKAISAIVLLCLSLFAQAPPPGCILDSATNRATVAIHAEVFPTPHYTFIRPSDCEVSAANRIIIVNGDNPSLENNGINMENRAEVTRFDKLASERLPLGPNEVGFGPLRYRVTAVFKGRLDVTPRAGLVRDPVTNKIIGLEGFGSPMPSTRYRLVVSSISDIVATERNPRGEH